MRPTLDFMVRSRAIFGERMNIGRQALKWGLLLLSLVVGVAQGVYLLHWFERYNKAGDHAIAFETMRGEIARLDEVLTMSARLYAATGDPIWRDRYLEHVEPLDRTLESALAIAANDEAQRAIDQVASSNAALIALEDHALGLTEEGRLAEALPLLSSPEYERLKSSYQQGLTNAFRISRNVLHNKVEGNRDKLMVAAFVLVIGMLCLSELWRRLSVREQRRAADQVSASLEREQRLSGLQRQFVSMFSHELRTPLAIIDGRAQYLLRRIGRLDDEKIRASSMNIANAVQHLMGLMEGVLNTARAEEGRIDIHPEDFDLAALIENVTAGHREVNEGRRIDLALGGLPSVVRGDPRLLTQVVSNLVSNALKYSDRSRPVRVEGYLEDASVVIAVHDEGIGIPEDEIEKLGQRFFRARSSAGIAGTGIGLHFINHLIDLHEGRIEIRSTEGVGSSFLVHLPHRMVVQPTTEACPSDMAEPALTAA